MAEGVGVPKTGLWSLVPGLMVIVTVEVPIRAGVPGTPWSDACRLREYTQQHLSLIHI